MEWEILFLDTKHQNIMLAVWKTSTRNTALDLISPFEKPVLRVDNPYNQMYNIFATILLAFLFTIISTQGGVEILRNKDMRLVGNELRLLTAICWRRAALFCASGWRNLVLVCAHPVASCRFLLQIYFTTFVTFVFRSNLYPLCGWFT